jgi:phytoene desaturase
MHAVPRALAAAAARHGVIFRYSTTATRVETYGDRALAVHTDSNERVPADVVVLNPDLPVAYRELLPAVTPPARLARLRFSPSCVVVHLGSRQSYSKIAHHNLHFGRAWEAAFEDVITHHRFMRDPSLLVTNPTRSDADLAPAGREIYYVLVPVPNLAVDGRAGSGFAGSPDESAWRAGLGDQYATELVNTLERRGYVGLGASIEMCRAVTPADWAAAGHAAGTPFSAAHTFGQTGPFRPANLHPRLSNVVFVGSGTHPGVGVPMVLTSGKLAAQRITGIIG